MRKLNTGSACRTSAGFTILELMIVLGIVGIMAAFAVPSIGRYRLREQTLESAQLVASVLRAAHAASVKDGVQLFVIFNPGAPSPAGTVVRLVRDLDGDWQESVGDIGTDYAFAPATDAVIVPVGTAGTNTPFDDSTPVPGDPSGGDLSNVVNGANFPADPNTGQPALGFGNQGVPVDLNTPTAWGSGAGAYYVTDGSSAVYAAVIGPLGEVRVRSLNPGTGQWQ